ncbi:MAG: hypothetical protein ACUVRZ_06540 [Desulfobacca sp.]|uniref:hypothetical protein n=1 Tax=Desulfobacca sp. TaxID=2067990 RepID=UPI00404AA838
MSDTFRQRQLHSLSRKAVILFLGLGLGLGVYWLILRYWHILDAYVYTLEFHLMFQVNNLRTANLPLFAEYFGAMGLKGQFWVMAVLTLIIQNFWRPWTKPIVAPALMAAFAWPPAALSAFSSCSSWGCSASAAASFPWGISCLCCWARSGGDSVGRGDGESNWLFWGP